MSLPNYLQKIKSAGIYRFVFDKSEIPAESAEILRLVVGYSDKGPFNTPVYIESPTDFITIFGNVSKKLERNGVYFHRMALQALSAGPIIALNIKKFCEKETITDKPEVVKALSLNADEPMIEVADIDLLIKEVYNTTRFWTLEPEHLEDISKSGLNKNYIELTATDSKETSCTVFMRGYTPTGYDVTLNHWYSSVLNGQELPEYMENYANTLVSQYFAEIYVFRGEFTLEIATSEALADYFVVEDGKVYLKPSIINAFGEKIDTLQALAENEASHFINSYSGCLLPDFQASNGNIISLDHIFNADYDNHKLMMRLNQALLYDGEVELKNIDTTGWLKGTASFDAMSVRSAKGRISPYKFENGGWVLDGSDSANYYEYIFGGADAELSSNQDSDGVWNLRYRTSNESDRDKIEAFDLQRGYRFLGAEVDNKGQIATRVEEKNTKSDEWELEDMQNHNVVWHQATNPADNFEYYPSLFRNTTFVDTRNGENFISGANGHVGDADTSTNQQTIHIEDPTHVEYYGIGSSENNIEGYLAQDPNNHIIEHKVQVAHFENQSLNYSSYGIVESVGGDNYRVLSAPEDYFTINSIPSNDNRYYTEPKITQREAYSFISYQPGYSDVDHVYGAGIVVVESKSDDGVLYKIRVVANSDTTFTGNIYWVNKNLKDGDNFKLFENEECSIDAHISVKVDLDDDQYDLSKHAFIFNAHPAGQPTDWGYGLVCIEHQYNGRTWVVVVSDSMNVTTQMGHIYMVNGTEFIPGTSYTLYEADGAPTVPGVEVVIDELYIGGTLVFNSFDSSDPETQYGWGIATIDFAGSDQTKTKIKVLTNKVVDVTPEWVGREFFVHTTIDNFNYAQPYPLYDSTDTLEGVSVEADFIQYYTINDETPHYSIIPTINNHHLGIQMGQIYPIYNNSGNYEYHGSMYIYDVSMSPLQSNDTSMPGRYPFKSTYNGNNYYGAVIDEGIFDHDGVRYAKVTVISNTVPGWNGNQYYLNVDDVFPPQPGNSYELYDSNFVDLNVQVECFYPSWGVFVNQNIYGLAYCTIAAQVKMMPITSTNSLFVGNYYDLDTLVTLQNNNHKYNNEDMGDFYVRRAGIENTYHTVDNALNTYYAYNSDNIHSFICEEGVEFTLDRDVLGTGNYSLDSDNIDVVINGFEERYWTGYDEEGVMHQFNSNEPIHYYVLELKSFDKEVLINGLSIFYCNSSITASNVKLQPTYIAGYTRCNSLAKPQDNTQKAKLDWQKSAALAALTDYEGLRLALTGNVDIEYHYIVDTFDSYVEKECKSILSNLAKQKDNCILLANFPKMKTFQQCEYTKFVDGNNNFNTKYIVLGGNRQYPMDVTFSLPTEENGASWSAFYTQLIIRDPQTGIKYTCPSAALVSNDFMEKYQVRQPYSVVAGPDFGSITVNGLIGPDFNFCRQDLDNLEPMGVNCIVYAPRKGVYINANQSAKQNPVTTLSSINVRDLIIYIQDTVHDILQSYQWWTNNADLRSKIKKKVDYLLENVKNNGGVYDYTTCCDSSNNTDEVIDNGMFIIDIDIEAARGAGKMIQRLTLYRKGGIASMSIS